MSKFLTALNSAMVEKDVENAYRAEISTLRPDIIWSSPYGTDGYAEWPQNVRLLLEAKYDENFKSRIPVCGVLGQVIYYIKRFEQAGTPLPNVLLIADKNECLVLSTNVVSGFLNLPLDWSVAPSKEHPELLRALVEGINILPYAFDVDGKLDFRTILTKIEALAKGELHTIRATEQNLGAIFTYWHDHVFRNNTGVTPVEQVDVFLRCLFQPDEVSLHTTKLGVLVVPGYPQGILVDADQYRSFFDQFQQGYKPSEIERFYAMKDRLVEDDARRRQGAFFTPALWVAEAHKELDRVLGKHWREECLVWDPAAGTGNLTRDYRFKDLIVSTAEKPDVQVIRDQGYNPGCLLFQYDFLNPDAESPFFEDADGAQNILPKAVDKKLKEAAIAGKRLVFLMNPPYGTANNAGANGTSKAGIALTVANRNMKQHNLGAPSQQLYAQFMFQAVNLAQSYDFKSWTVALFANPKFMCSGSYRPFREWWYKQHSYQGGFLFQASHFADVSGRWGISFTVWNNPGTTNGTKTIPVTLKDMQAFTVAETGSKSLYNADDQEASSWIREPIRGLKSADAPQMSSGLVVKEKGRGALIPKALFFFGNNANSLQDSGTLVYMVSSADTRNHGLSVHCSNYRRAVALFAARKFVLGDWINDKDEYLIPNTSLPGYEQWVNDCHIYNLLHGSNNCTAMRNVQYKGKSWRIKNHWFWLSRNETLNFLDTPKTPNLYRDCKQEPTKTSNINPITGEDETQPWELTGDAYFAYLLCNNSLKLSPDAQRVLDLLQALWLKSLPFREDYAAGHPDLHLLAWDAGIYQCKHLWRDLFPDEWKELQEAFKVLSDRLRPGVYEYGFLRR